MIWSWLRFDLDELAVGLSPLPADSPNEVAIFLAKICPAATISAHAQSSGWRSMISRDADDTEELSARRELWAEVGELVKMLVRFGEAGKRRIASLEEEVKQLKMELGGSVSLEEE